jgi:hypothetical protein
LDYQTCCDLSFINAFVRKCLSFVWIIEGYKKNDNEGQAYEFNIALIRTQRMHNTFLASSRKYCRAL